MSRIKARFLKRRVVNVVDLPAEPEPPSLVESKAMLYEAASRNLPEPPVRADTFAERAVVYLLSADVRDVEFSLRQVAHELMPRRPEEPAPKPLSDERSREITGGHLGRDELFALGNSFYYMRDISAQPSGHLATEISMLQHQLRGSRPRRHSSDYPSTFAHVTSVGGEVEIVAQYSPEELTWEQNEDLASTSGRTIDHALARLFLRLGPPPEASPFGCVPASTGDGGAAQ
ncbi:hypothetical protein AB0E78_05810 [Streptomyces sp. NPDC032198]|uniref:hypothetical protein n=1 Tax=Streptomyces sp. NPDC032198 TaxID=3155127 RepID=UPI0033E9AE23